VSAARHASPGSRRQRPLRLEVWRKRALLDGFDAALSFGVTARRRPVQSALSLAMANFTQISERVMLRLGHGPEWTFDQLLAGQR
jgi:hypothetical protein